MKYTMENKWKVKMLFVSINRDCTDVHIELFKCSTIHIKRSPTILIKTFQVNTFCLSKTCQANQ